jgi:serine/threonine protein phosphatase PrpC
MSRSLGDGDVGPLILPFPEVSRIAVPKETGGRLIVASDGLWDGVDHPEGAIAAVSLFIDITYHISHITDHVSQITYHISHITYHISHITGPGYVLRR